MNLRQLKVIGFSCATLDALTLVINKVTSGAAVTALETGTEAYPANWVGNKVFLEKEYYAPSTTLYTCLLFYGD